MVYLFVWVGIFFPRQWKCLHSLMKLTNDGFTNLSLVQVVPLLVMSIFTVVFFFFFFLALHGVQWFKFFLLYLLTLLIPFHNSQFSSFVKLLL